jgi:hypothetical protein
VVGNIREGGGPGQPEQQQLLEESVAYEVLCRRHHRAGITRSMADGEPGHVAAR